jgi:hypothetical protein
MVLVDTSAWIRALRKREAYVTHLDGPLRRDGVAGHEFIYRELLAGDRGVRGIGLAADERMYQAQTFGSAELVALVRGRKLHRRGIGWIDVHRLASVMTGGLHLWTVDLSFAPCAEELGIAYTPRVS